MLDLEKTAQRYGAQSIEIHDWDGSGMIEVRARRPGLYNMASMGFIPNPLLGAMQAMFSGSTAQINAVDAKKQGECLTAIARYALVEPTMAQITEAGLELTDQQLLELYQFALAGPVRYAAFRAAADGAAAANGAEVPGAPERAAE
nr:MAG TPA: hypothetical protein [Caudoviricetes sp.]